MARKKAEIVRPAVVENVKKKAPAKAEEPVKAKAPAPMADKYRAIAHIRSLGKEYKPGDIVDVDIAEIKMLRKQNAIELVED